MKYYMTVYDQAQGGLWDACKATSLHGAKVEATRKLADEVYRDRELRIGIDEYAIDNGPVRVVASRRDTWRAWRNW